MMMLIPAGCRRLKRTPRFQTADHLECDLRVGGLVRIEPRLGPARVV